MDSKLKNRLLEEIAKSYPFSLADVSSVYDATKSIDATIQVCEAANKMGMSNLVNVRDMLVDGVLPRTKGEITLGQFSYYGPREDA